MLRKINWTPWLILIIIALIILSYYIWEDRKAVSRAFKHQEVLHYHTMLGDIGRHLEFMSDILTQYDPSMSSDELELLDKAYLYGSWNFYNKGLHMVYQARAVDPNEEAVSNIDRTDSLFSKIQSIFDHTALPSKVNDPDKILKMTNSIKVAADGINEITRKSTPEATTPEMLNNVKRIIENLSAALKDID